MALELDALDLGLPALRLGGKKRPKDTLTPEEQESLLRRVGGTIGSGLQYVGETLDKPGRALRGLLAGRPSELANLVPFSDTIGLTNPAESTTGRQLLEHAGIVGRNRPGLDLGDVLGFGAEVVADPLNLVVGPGKAVAKTFSLMKPVAKVEKTFKNFDTLADALGAGIKVHPWDAQKIDNLEKMAEAARKAHDFNAQQVIRDTRAANKVGTKGMTDEQVLAEALKKRPMASINKELVSTFRKSKKIASEQADEAASAIDTLLPKQEITRDILEHPGVSPSRIIEEIGRGDRGLVGLKLPWEKQARMTSNFGLAPETAAKVAEKAYYATPVRYMRHLFDYRVQKAKSDKLAQQIADRAFAHQFDELANVHEHFVEINKRLPEVEKQFNELHKLYPNMQPKNFQEALRDAAETKGYDYMQNLARSAGAPANLMQHAQNFDNLAKQIGGLQDAGWKHALSLGMTGKDLDDAIAHSFRRINPLMHKYMQSLADSIGTNFGGAKRRINPFRGVLTSRLNAISTDPSIAGKWYGKLPTKDEVAATAKYLEDTYQIPNASRTITGSSRPYNQAKALARIVMTLHPKVFESGGLFPRTSIMDALDYLRNLTGVRGALMGTHDMIHRFADAAADGPTVKELFNGLNLNKQGLESFARKWSENHPGQAVNPFDLRVPQELANSAHRILDYHINPQKVEGLLKVLDDVTGFIKGSLTVPFPAFHMRNLISGLWQNAVTAFENPLEGGIALKEAWDALRGKNSQLLEEMRIHGALPEGGIGGDIFRGGQAHETELLGNVFNPMRWLRRGGENFAAGTKRGEGIGNFLMGRETKTGEHIGGLGTWGRDATHLVEFINRASHYIARRKAGWSPEMAARSTRLVHFDYSRLSNFEKQIAKRVAPFYAFSAFNAPLQMRELMNAPGGGTAKTVRAMSVARREGGAGSAGQPSWLPARLGESTAFMLPGQNPNQRDLQFASENALLPLSEALNRWPTEGGVPNLKLIGENLLSMVHPFVQEPVSIVTNRSFWKHTPRDTLWNGPTGNETLDALLAMPPFGRASALARTLGDERKSALEKAFNAGIGGARITNVDLKRELLTHLRRALEARLEGQPGVGEFTERYIRDLSRASPQTVEDLAQLNAVGKELTELRKLDEQSGRLPARPRPPKRKKQSA